MLRNKKGMMDDLFDFLVTVMAIVFLLFFVGGIMMRSVEHSNSQSVSALSELRRVDSALNNLRVQLQEGSNLETADIPQLIEKSTVLEGRVITSCADYWAREDCENDIVQIGGFACRWKEAAQRCAYVPPPPSMKS